MIAHRTGKVVEGKCLNDIINWLEYEQFFCGGKCVKLLNKEGYDLEKRLGCHRLYQDMLWLNLQAADLIQLEDYKVYIEDDDYDFNPHMPNPGLFQALNSIHYWLCACKGEPTASSILFRTFSKLVRQMPEYAVLRKPPSPPKSQLELECLQPYRFLTAPYKAS